MDPQPWPVGQGTTHLYAVWGTDDREVFDSWKRVAEAMGGFSMVTVESRTEMEDRSGLCFVPTEQGDMLGAYWFSRHVDKLATWCGWSMERHFIANGLPHPAPLIATIKVSSITEYIHEEGWIYRIESIQTVVDDRVRETGEATVTVEERHRPQERVSRCQRAKDLWDRIVHAPVYYRMCVIATNVEDEDGTKQCLAERVQGIMHACQQELNLPVVFTGKSATASLLQEFEGVSIIFEGGDDDALRWAESVPGDQQTTTIVIPDSDRMNSDILKEMVYTLRSRGLPVVLSRLEMDPLHQESWIEVAFDE